MSIWLKLYLKSLALISIIRAKPEVLFLLGRSELSKWAKEIVHQRQWIGKMNLL